MWGFALACLVAGPGCDWGGGGGGGPTLAALPKLPHHDPLAGQPTDPVARGLLLYQARGCVLCHGEAGKGGVKNTNSETGGLINGLTLVKEGFTIEELTKRLHDGVPEVGKKNPKGPTPPLHMPGYAWLEKRETKDLIAYLLSIYPADRKVEDDWDDDDE